MSHDRATALVDRLDDGELRVPTDSHHTATPSSSSPSFAACSTFCTPFLEAAQLPFAHRSSQRSERICKFGTASASPNSQTGSGHVRRLPSLPPAFFSSTWILFSNFSNCFALAGSVRLQWHTSLQNSLLVPIHFLPEDVCLSIKDGECYSDRLK